MTVAPIGIQHHRRNRGRMTHLNAEQQERHRMGQRRRWARHRWEQRKMHPERPATDREIRALLFLGEDLLAMVRTYEERS